MIEIPENHSEDLIAQQKAAHQRELDTIANQFLSMLASSDAATVGCSEHMIGYQCSNPYHHLCDTIEVAKQFSRKGYYCYYYDYYNSHGVNQRAVCVRKTPMPEGERRGRSLVWYEI